MGENLVKDVTIVMITYNSSRFLEKSLKQVKGIHTIIVDNASKDKSVAIAKKHKANVIANKDNKGYATAANQGIKSAKTPYVLLINPDVYITKAAITKLIAVLKKESSIDIIAPKLTDLQGNTQHSCKRFPTITALIGRRTGLFKKAVDKYTMKDYDHKKPRKVDWVSGGCLVFKQKLRFDERYFLYFEDTDFCQGRNVWYYPTITAIHEEQRESTKSFKLFCMHIKSMIQYFCKRR